MPGAPLDGLDVRQAKRGDRPFLRTMIFEAAYGPQDERPPFEDALADPEVRRYVVGWGRPGDTGVIGGVAGRQVGAAWYRLFSREEPGWGFIDPQTPEIAIAVVPELRGRGIGSLLFAALIDAARQEEVLALSLCVSELNPAVRLYLRNGFVRVESSDGYWTMRLDLTSEAR